MTVNGDGFDRGFKALNQSKKCTHTNPLNVTEIQYLRGLVMSDQLNNGYKNKCSQIRIDQNTAMYDFTQGLLKKLDELEELEFDFNSTPK